MNKFVLHITLSSLLFLAIAVPAIAQECRPIYGGGVTTQEVCGDKVMTPQTSANPKPLATPTPIKRPTGTPQQQPPTTKGGLPVLTPTPTNQTPSTGPEAFGILALIPAGALGYYLRKKSVV